MSGMGVCLTRCQPHHGQAVQNIDRHQLTLISHHYSTLSNASQGSLKRTPLSVSNGLKATNCALSRSHLHTHMLALIWNEYQWTASILIRAHHERVLQAAAQLFIVC